MAKSHTRYSDWGRFSASFADALMDCKYELTKRGKEALIKECDVFLKELDSQWPHSTTIGKGKHRKKFGGDHNHPWYYGQLHDSVAVRVADKNRTVAALFMPAKAAMNSPQHANSADAGAAYDRIIGAEWAQEMVRRAQYRFLPGIQAELIVGVPYARKVNESPRHRGYLDEMQLDFIDRVETLFEGTGTAESPLKRGLIKPRKK